LLMVGREFSEPLELAVALTDNNGVRIWESYLENKKAGALRMFWVYGPEPKEITIVGIEYHPEPGRGLARVRLAPISCVCVFS